MEDVYKRQLLMCTINNINTEVESLKKLTNAYMRQDLNQMLRISEERKMCIRDR